MTICIDYSLILFHLFIHNRFKKQKNIIIFLYQKNKNLTIKNSKTSFLFLDDYRFLKNKDFL